jgi:ABC-type branched-subunit amino acid transport system ATPase component
MSFLSILAVEKSFDGIRAVDCLDWEIQENAISALIGPNGAGKTTVLELLTGFQRPDGGTIRYRGRNIIGLDPHQIARQGIVRTFQSPRLFLQMPVVDNLLLAVQDTKAERLTSAFTPMRRKMRKWLTRAHEHLEFVGLAAKRNDRAETLSYGQRKLLVLAQILCTEAQLLLLDEPMAGVYPETRSRITTLLRRLREQGKTIVFIEHDFRSVLALADHVLCMCDGRKIFEGSAKGAAASQAVIEAHLGRNTDDA